MEESLKIVKFINSFQTIKPISHSLPIFLPEIARKVVMTCCLLHKFLRVRSKVTYTPQGFADEIRWGWKCKKRSLEG